MKRLLLLLLFIPSLCLASPPTRQFTYVTHTTIDPAQNNANENALYTYLQNGVDTYSAGSISNTSISASAAIAYSKLNLLGSITGADLSASANIPYSKLSLSGSILNTDLAGSIADSKLLTISTAGKVNISALTVSSQAQGDIIYASGATTWARLGAGTSGQVLKTQGAAANPIWSNQVFALISATNVSVANNSGDITIDPTKNYLIRFSLDSQSADDTFNLRFNNNSSANYASSVGPTTGATSIVMSPTITGGGSTNDQINGEIQTFPQATGSGSMSVFGRIDSINSLGASLSAVITNFGGKLSSAAGITVSSFRIFTSSGATFNGNIYVYQISTS